MNLKQLTDWSPDSLTMGWPTAIPEEIIIKEDEIFMQFLLSVPQYYLPKYEEPKLKTPLSIYLKAKQKLG